MNHLIFNNLQKLIDYALACSLITKDDVFVVRNQLIEVLQLDRWEDSDETYSGETIDELLLPLVQYAVEQGIISDTASSRDLFDTKLMGVLTPMPRDVIKKFRQDYETSPTDATDQYFAFSKNLNYVRVGRIKKDMKWVYSCPYGDLDITINRSKPEKDPKDIAAAKNRPSSTYPKCQLCAENAGFSGHINHPARQNLRPIPLSVCGEEWQLQYSPYGYYNEHCIAFNISHVPMVIDRSVFAKLMDIVDYLPHYFMGSNADLPIVGGSILSHEHFQGGRYTFAMEKAPVETEVCISSFPSVKAGIVKWPMSVIRLSSGNREELIACCDAILTVWRNYSDERVGIFAETKGVPHNTITPIMRKKENVYECDLVLRNNITTKERPLGVFHPNPSLHHIKKENIGLIEVMGLAVLPARLATELVLLEEMMVNGLDLTARPETIHHAEWAKAVLSAHPEFSADNARTILEEEVGKVFLEVLTDAGVFKRNEEGQAAFLRFVHII